MVDKLEKVAESISIEKGKEGAMNGEKTRVRLIRERKLREKRNEMDLNDMIERTGKISALSAINLSQLLTKKWTEEKNAYMIMSQIRTEKQDRRINDMCFNRYKV